jgi:hypothetical protein
MTKRLVLVALVMAAALVLAAPAMAFDGYRSDYTPTYGQDTVSCEGCHSNWSEFTEWQSTSHAMVGTASIVEDPPGTYELTGTANAEPIADGHVEDPVTGFYPWENTVRDDAFTEPFVGCSTCHVGFASTHEAFDGTPKSNLANADICGQCHSRYSNSVVPYENYDGTSAVRQYTLGNFSPLGTLGNGWTPESITNYLNIPTPTAPQQMYYYKDAEGNLLPWSARGHEEGAQQYNEWAMEGHANSLNAIKAFGSDSCLECHSADYRMAEEGAKPTIKEAKYGVTCQVCHDPHAQSEQTSLWNEERNPQLTAPREELCVECHNAEIPAGETATPGSVVHHPMKEIMDGTGAIGVPEGSPSVHKGKCVQCHMVPTDYDRNGVPMTGANHVFAIVEPDVAAESLSTAAIGGVKRPLPASSCSLCHGRSSDPYAQYLSGTFENRQNQMKTWDGEVTAELTAAAARMGYASTSAAVSAINEKDQADWNASELAFQSAYTNQTYIESERSWGIHNWPYASAVIQKALEQAKSVKDTLDGITIDQSPAPYTTPKTITYGQTVVISGKVMGGDADLMLGGMAVIWAKPASGTRYTPVGSTYLFGDNVDMYSVSVMPAEQTRYIVQFAGNASYEALVSTAYLDVKVKWKLAIKSSASNANLNAKVTFSGSVGPKSTGSVTIEKAKAGGTYSKVTTATVDSAGNYSKAVKMAWKGTWYFHITFPADATHLANKSAYIKVVVK